ncbi:MAG: iron-sulfur cluster assembly scaffold protein [Bryobacterales bacterium]|nr:iron-sulfur cluster assembly scaffold protein [Bryobacterales bacterium]
MFSPELLDHFRNPRNAGTLESPALKVRVENPVCGDILELSANIDGGRITEIRFQARGCTASIACGSATAQLLDGRAQEELIAIDAARIEGEVGGLEAASKHAARLASDGVKALRSAIGDQLRRGA